MPDTVANPPGMTLGEWAKEVFLFIVLGTLIIMVVRILHYSSIRKRVQAESRCARERNLSRQGRYVVEVSNSRKEPMYKITYDLGARQYYIECNCEKGSVVNTFEKIKVRDVRHPSQPDRKVQKICACNTDLVTGTTQYYYGNPDIVRYMKSDDSSFFRKANPLG